MMHVSPVETALDGVGDFSTSLPLDFYKESCKLWLLKNDHPVDISYLFINLKCISVKHFSGCLISYSAVVRTSFPTCHMQDEVLKISFSYALDYYKQNMFFSEIIITSHEIIILNK